MLIVSSVVYYAQTVIPGRTLAATSNCQVTTAKVAGQGAFIASDQYQRPCVIAAATKDSSGLTINDTATTGASTTPVNVSTTPTQLYGIMANAGTNTAATVFWVNIFNVVSASVTPGTTPALMSIPVFNNIAGSPVVMPFGAPIGIPVTALSVNCTTLRNGSVAATQNCALITATR